VGLDRIPAAVEVTDREIPRRLGPPRPVPSVPIPVPSLPPRPVPSLPGFETDHPPHSRPWRWLAEWLAVVVLALVLAAGVREYALQLFYIPSGSMLPTLQIGDRIVVDKLAYRFEPVRRGDVVVFSRPPLEDADYKDLVKRVIGLPGETLSLAGGQVYVDGRLLEEPWLPRPAPPTTPSPADAAFSLAHPFTVPAGQYFVMGDDRTDSEDSRFFGPIPRDLIVGKMAFVAWPVDDDGWLVVLSAAAVVLLVALAVVNRPRRHLVPRQAAAQGVSPRDLPQEGARNAVHSRA
jgi:signal peptidase I